ncbi:hypothetical protein KGQ71_01525 [Patescibacteria group bacterium]|nr:hypothetical protein [Patescibacteria group bacterium]
MAKEEKAQHEIQFKVDGVEYTTTEQTLTPLGIMGIAGVDHTNHYLVQIEGNHRESYQEKEEVVIHMHEHMKFICIYTGAETVS